MYLKNEQAVIVHHSDRLLIDESNKNFQKWQIFSVTIGLVIILNNSNRISSESLS